MSLVNIINVQVLDNPSNFSSPFKFEITFECLASLEQDLEWKIIYVGSAESERYDQVLDSIMVGPVPIGINKFVFQADPPNVALIPPTEIRGVTVVLLVCSYLEQEFVRVGYYVDSDYEDPLLRETPPEPVQIELLKRSILADKPRVTRFNIKWDPMKLKSTEVDMPQELMDLKVEDEEMEDTENEEDEDEDEDDDEDDDEMKQDASSSSNEEMMDADVQGGVGSSNHNNTSMKNSTVYQQQQQQQPQQQGYSEPRSETHLMEKQSFNILKI